MEEALAGIQVDSEMADLGNVQEDLVVLEASEAAVVVVAAEATAQPVTPSTRRRASQGLHPASGTFTTRSL